MPDTVEKTLSRADGQIHVQVLNPNRWFIPRGFPPTHGNQVTPLIDGKRAMAEMAIAFSGATYIYYAGWQLDENTRLVRDSGTTTHSLNETLGRAVTAGADARVLIWEGSRLVGDVRPDPANPNSKLNLFASNGLTAADLRGRGVQVVLDSHNQTLLGANLGSIHQKTAVTDGGGQGPVGFCGGIDICFQRWDSPAHPAFDSRRDADASAPFHNPDPWHDVHAMVRGPAVADLETNLADRWDENGQGNMTRHPVPPAAPGGTHTVQVLRTLPADNIHTFAPRGEFGIRAAYLLAIRSAQEYIYIENQYLVSETITQALIDAMTRNRGRNFRVLVVIPHTPAEAAGSGGGSGRPGAAILFHTRQMIQRLKAGDPGGMFSVFHLRQPAGPRDIYVHAKVMIVDDIWATIGSANANRRSLAHDAEINLAVVDEAISEGRRAFARNLRLALWSEHLGLTGAELAQISDPIAGAAVWAARARPGFNQSHVEEHDENQNPGSDNVLLWDSVIDPGDETRAEVREWEVP